MRIAPRWTIRYEPIWRIKNRKAQPAITLERLPDPRCGDCDGWGSIPLDMDCINELDCTCAPADPVGVLLLPRSVNRPYKWAIRWRNGAGRPVCSRPTEPSTAT